MIATKDLRTLVQTGLVVQHRTKRWTYYTLNVAAQLPLAEQPLTEEAKILVYVREHGRITNMQCRQLLSVDTTRAYYLLTKLSNDGLLQIKGEKRWTRYILS